MKTLFFTVVFLLSACSSELAVSPAIRAKRAVTIETLDRITAQPGDVVEFAGTNLSSTLR